MSTEAENNNEKDNNNNKNNNQAKENNQEISELIKKPFVKQLLIKIDVLKNGVLEERQKVTALSQKINELQEEAKLKSEQIKILVQEKVEYEKKQKEKEEEEGKNKNNQYQAGDEIHKLNEEIIKLKFENETFMKRMNVTLQETEDTKFEYKKQIKSLSEKNSSLLKDIKNLKSEKEELEEKLKKSALSVTSESMREKEHFDNLLREYKKAKEEAIHQLDACLDKCSKLVMENKTYKDTICLHEIDAGKMAQKLAEYKNSLIKVNLRNQVYHVKKVGLVSSTEIDVIFTQDKDGNYIMRIDEKGNSDIINIQDVESINLVDKKKNKVEISYMYKAKKYSYNVIVNELIIDQFVEAYKNFYSESMKNQF